MYILLVLSTYLLSPFFSLLSYSFHFSFPFPILLLLLLLLLLVLFSSLIPSTTTSWSLPISPKPRTKPILLLCAKGASSPHSILEDNQHLGVWAYLALQARRPPQLPTPSSTTDTLAIAQYYLPNLQYR
ncbi:hypothetical protein F5B22DRAFT_72221 [Xylaria bambusicola]|uniref:uncharacterized protein n=1 Tax=Xylaria bambusicola TaxID=326684 RepID=UPI002007C525|nr:uncharacterized protein F5B22DRAFT_72221 [Xylaria bambusicola]KAI0518573.1 hypothetical protein F5B22DRAFT_72221 [Xylaria bambusicola]